MDGKRIVDVNRRTLKKPGNSTREEAIRSITCQTRAARSDWQSFCDNPTVMGAITFLNSDSPVFYSFIRYLEEIEGIEHVPDREELEKKIEELWYYYQKKLTPVLHTFLTKKLAGVYKYENIIEDLLQGRTLTAMQSRKIKRADQQLSEIRVIRDIIQAYDGVWSELDSPAMPMQYIDAINYFFK
ncbi:MAG: hypothetical protein ABIH39_05490 [Candidatus Margulisiibacteriota bacterium]